MLNFNTSRLENSCRKLKESLNDQLTWKWDERFGTVLAEFNVNDKELIHKIIKIHMGVTFSEDNSGDASAVAKLVIDYFGGLNSGQLMYMSDPDKEDLILCAWWPWGNGSTISIRLGVFADSLNDEDNAELTQMLRQWFDL